MMVCKYGYEYCKREAWSVCSGCINDMKEAEEQNKKLRSCLHRLVDSLTDPRPTDFLDPSTWLVMLDAVEEAKTLLKEPQ